MNTQIDYDCKHCKFKEIKDGLHGYVCEAYNKPIEDANCFRNRDCHKFDEK